MKCESLIPLNQERILIRFLMKDRLGRVVNIVEHIRWCPVVIGWLYLQIHSEKSNWLWFFFNYLMFCMQTSVPDIVVLWFKKTKQTKQTNKTKQNKKKNSKLVSKWEMKFPKRMVIKNKTHYNVVFNISIKIISKIVKC